MFKPKGSSKERPAKKDSLVTLTSDIAERSPEKTLPQSVFPARTALRWTTRGPHKYLSLNFEGPKPIVKRRP